MAGTATAQKSVAGASIGHLGGSDLDYAISLVSTICALAGPTNYLADLRTSARKNGLIQTVAAHDTPALFEWFVGAASFQGISDSVAAGYMENHGRAWWQDLEIALAAGPSCPRLENYWRFYGCQYHKGSGTCAEPDHIEACSLPTLPLRNGRLNTLAYSLFLFIRDQADGDLVRWIDRRLARADQPPSVNRLGAMGQALIDPLRNIYGLSDKVLNMVLANLLLGAGHGKARWLETGGSLLAVDTLVHNFLGRTGILDRGNAAHAYGPLCYGPAGCAAILRTLSAEIDAQQFNANFPADFPRFIQSAIWHYCAGDGLNICNGNKIDDSKPCENTACRINGLCDRLALENL